MEKSAENALCEQGKFLEKFSKCLQRVMENPCKRRKTFTYWKKSANLVFECCIWLFKSNYCMTCCALGLRTKFFFLFLLSLSAILIFFAITKDCEKDKFCPDERRTRYLCFFSATYPAMGRWRGEVFHKYQRT